MNFGDEVLSFIARGVSLSQVCFVVVVVVVVVVIFSKYYTEKWTADEESGQGGCSSEVAIMRDS